MSFNVVAHLEPVPSPTAARQRPGSTSGALDFATVYDEWFDRVASWLRALGAPMADHEDLAQEVFLVVRRRLPDFDGVNLGAWLFRIARRQVLRHRRLVWVKRVFVGSSGDALDELVHPSASPSALLETREKERLVAALLAGMSEKRRVVLVLFELEGASGEEIAELLGVPINTVWTRLHHARKDFFERLAAHRRAQGGDA
jgi:RNA polymerase sigma-70 factor (ECF subfamily)